MGNALQSVAAVRKLLAEIAHAAGEQRSGVSQINTAVAQLDGATQQNAAMVEQIAAASRSLDAQVESVLDSITIFRLSAADVTLAERDAVELRRSLKDAVAAA